MVINPTLCNRITMESQSLKNSVTKMQGVQQNFDKLHIGLAEQNETLLREWSGNAREAFAITNQQTKTLAESLLKKVEDIADNTADFEEKMVMTDILAGEAVGD